MIGRLRGTLVAREGAHVVIDCGGVGYEVTCSGYTLGALPALDEEVTLRVFTHTNAPVGDSTRSTSSGNRNSLIRTIAAAEQSRIGSLAPSACTRCEGRVGDNFNIASRQRPTIAILHTFTKTDSNNHINDFSSKYILHTQKNLQTTYTDHRTKDTAQKQKLIYARLDMISPLPTSSYFISVAAAVPSKNICSDTARTATILDALGLYNPQTIAPAAVAADCLTLTL